MSSEEEEARPKGKKKNKDFTSLCFMVHGDEKLSDSDTSEVDTPENFTYKVEQLESALVKQDNLFRVASRENKDLISKLESSHVEIASLKQDNLVCGISRIGKVFRADFSIAQSSHVCLLARPSSDLWLWHRRLGHMSFDLFMSLKWPGGDPRIA